MSPRVRERKVEAIARHEKSLENWEKEQKLTNDNARITYCKKKIEKCRTTIDNTKSNLK